MLTKQTTIDQITVTANGIIMLREVTDITENGITLSHTYHRSSLIPGQNLTGQPANVIAVATAVWNPALIAAYQAQYPVA